MSTGIWADGLLLAVLLGFAIRPLVVGVLLLPIRLEWGERLFVMWSGLKGAVPILLAALALIAEVEYGTEIYRIVFVVVLFSVLVQGSLLPVVANRLRVPMRRVEQAAATVRRFDVRPGSYADGAKVGLLPLGERAWVSTLVRDGRPRRLGGATTLEAGDEVHVLCDEDDEPALQRIFEGR